MKKAKNIVGIDIPYPKPCNINFEINSDENIDTSFSRINMICDELIPGLY